MPLNDELGKRMKTYYEEIPKIKLMRRTPVAIRIDGRAFHSYTKGFDRPFDDLLIKTMQETTKYLCENTQGCVLGYTQSDEITLLLVDYKKLTSSAFFDYEVQKICSITASMATKAFGKAFEKNVYEYSKDKISNQEYIDALIYGKYPDGISALLLSYLKALHKGAELDSRCFNIPKEEATNLVYWRQLDASRNSIQMVGQANFSEKELHEKSNSAIQDMLMIRKGINWNDFETHKKRGSCVVKKEYLYGDTIRTHWVVDKEIPIFKADNREYIDKLIYVGD